LAVVLAIMVAGVVSYSAYEARSTTTQQFTTTNPTFGSTINIGFISEITVGIGDIGVGRVGLTPVDAGYAARIGAELAVNQTNAAGGVDGRSINLIIEDSQSNPQRAEQQAATLDQKDGVLAITGPTNQEDALAISGYAETHGVPFVVSTVSSAVLTPPGSNWTVSVQPDAVQWGVAVGKYVSEAVPGAKIALMTQNADQQKEMSAGVQWYADTYKNESIIFNQQYANSQFPWATAAEAAKFSGANAVVVSWLAGSSFSQSNVVEALLSAGFLQSQIFVASIDDQVSDLGLNATGIRGVTLFDGAMTAGYPNASAFVTQVEPYIYGQKSPPILYCGICPKEIGPNYYYSYLGMEMMINAIKDVLSSGQVLTRADFMSTLKSSSIVDAFGNTLRINPSGSSTGTYYVAMVQQLGVNGTTYDMKLLKSFEFAPGSIPAYEIAKSD